MLNRIKAQLSGYDSVMNVLVELLAIDVVNSLVNIVISVIA